MAQKRKDRTRCGFNDLPAEEKERIYREIDESPPWKIEAGARPLTRADRKLFAPIRRKLSRGRPKIGKGSKVVAVSVEAGLLADADAYAKQRGIGRTELFVEGLRLALAR